MAPRLKIFMSAGSIKRTQLFFSFLSKIPANEHSPGSPTGALWKEILLYRVFCISLEKPHKNLSNKKALRKKPPSIFPTSGAPMEADAYF